jgi:hypothetical protein
MLKKITAFVLLIALMVNVMGYFVIFQCNRFLIRHEMAALISSGAFRGKTHLIKILKDAPCGDLVFKDKNEFSYRGSLYDIVSATSSSDTIIYTCIRDDNEQNLTDKFALFLRQHSGFQETSKAKPILALIQHLIFQALVQKPALPKPFTEKDFLFPVMICRFTTVYLPEPYPPPETC